MKQLILIQLSQSERIVSRVDLWSTSSASSIRQSFRIRSIDSNSNLKILRNLSSAYPFVQISSPVDGTIKKWLTHCRLANYIQTDIYIENLLAICLNQWKPSSMSIYYDKNETHPFIPFHTAASIQEFYQVCVSSFINFYHRSSIV